MSFYFEQKISRLIINKELSFIIEISMKSKQSSKEKNLFYVLKDDMDKHPHNIIGAIVKVNSSKR